MTTDHYYLNDGIGTLALFHAPSPEDDPVGHFVQHLDAGDNLSELVYFAHAHSKECSQ